MKKLLLFAAEVIGIFLLVVLDRMTKLWAMHSLQGGNGIELIRGVLKFYYLPNGNTGAAFGMFQGQFWLFALITVVIVALLFYLILVIPFQKRYYALHFVFVLIIAGGIGNLIDRLLYRFVVDFIYFYWINFPIFNVADCYVTVSTVVLAVLLLFIYREEDFKELEAKVIPSFFRTEQKDSE